MMCVEMTRHLSTSHRIRRMEPHDPYSVTIPPPRRAMHKANVKAKEETDDSEENVEETEENVEETEATDERDPPSLEEMRTDLVPHRSSIRPQRIQTLSNLRGAHTPARVPTLPTLPTLPTPTPPVPVARPRPKPTVKIVEPVMEPIEPFDLETFRIASSQRYSDEQIVIRYHQLIRVSRALKTGAKPPTSSSRRELAFLAVFLCNAIGLSIHAAMSDRRFGRMSDFVYVALASSACDVLIFMII